MSPLELKGRDHPYRILDSDEVARIQEHRNKYPNPRSAILPALWILQRKEGILTAEGMREVARALELPPGPVEAVASFYVMYFFQPHGRYVAEVCTNISCLLQGSGQVLRRFEDQLRIKSGGTTRDGLCTLLEAECLGACGGAPAAQINHRFFEHLTPQRVDQLVAQMQDGSIDLHPMPTGEEVAARETLVDLQNPGANRMALPAGGPAGEFDDLLKK